MIMISTIIIIISAVAVGGGAGPPPNSFRTAAWAGGQTTCPRFTISGPSGQTTKQ